MTPLFELDAVTVERAGRVVLDRVSLTLQPGERVALAGANGAGKTTLLRTLVGLERPTSGRLIAFGAERRAEKDFREVRARAGLLFQDPDDQLFSPTVIEDVAFGPLNLGLSPAEAIARAEADAGPSRARPSRPPHHPSSVGRREAARRASPPCWRCEPEVLLLDEPTNALDDVHLARLTDILGRARRGDGGRLARLCAAGAADRPRRADEERPAGAGQPPPPRARPRSRPHSRDRRVGASCPLPLWERVPSDHQIARRVRGNLAPA